MRLKQIIVVPCEMNASTEFTISVFFTIEISGIKNESTIAFKTSRRGRKRELHLNYEQWIGLWEHMDEIDDALTDVYWWGEKRLVDISDDLKVNIFNNRFVAPVFEIVKSEGVKRDWIGFFETEWSSLYEDADMIQREMYKRVKSKAFEQADSNVIAKIEAAKVGDCKRL